MYNIYIYVSRKHSRINFEVELIHPKTSVCEVRKLHTTNCTRVYFYIKCKYIFFPTTAITCQVTVTIINEPLPNNKHCYFLAWKRTIYPFLYIHNNDLTLLELLRRVVKLGWTSYFLKLTSLSWNSFNEKLSFRSL